MRTAQVVAQGYGSIGRRRAPADSQHLSIEEGHELLFRHGGRLVGVIANLFNAFLELRCKTQNETLERRRCIPSNG